MAVTERSLGSNPSGASIKINFLPDPPFALTEVHVKQEHWWILAIEFPTVPPLLLDLLSGLTWSSCNLREHESVAGVQDDSAKVDIDIERTWIFCGSPNWYSESRHWHFVGPAVSSLFQAKRNTTPLLFRCFLKNTALTDFSRISCCCQDRCQWEHRLPHFEKLGWNQFNVQNK